MDDKEIEKLIAEAKAGDSAAEDKLLRNYMGLVKSIAFSFAVAFAMSSEDLVQEGMLALMRAVRKYDGGAASFWTFASHCIKNAMIDELRKVGGEQTISIEQLDLDHPADDGSDDLADAIQEAIEAALTPAEKQAISLYLDGHSYREIAQSLQMDTKKVDNLLFSAKNKLKKHFEDD